MSTVSSQLQSLSNPEQVYNRLGVSAEQISEFCQRWKISELALFGSVLSEDFHEKSDIDFLYVFCPDTHWGLIDWVNMIEILETLVQRPVDLVSKVSVENSHNWIRRRNILGTAQVIYEVS